MDWSNGFMARFYMTELDPIKWRDLDRYELSGGSIRNSDSGIRSTATIDVNDFDNSIERWVRIYMEARQGNDSWRGAIFTGITDVTDTSIDGGVVKQSLPCNSVLKAAEDVFLPMGWNILAGTNGANAVKDLLSIIGAPIDVAEGSPTLVQNIVADSSDSRLSMADKILSSIGWILKLYGDGSIYIGPPTDFGAKNEKEYFDALENDVVELRLSISESHAEVPNVFRAISDDQVAIARDDSKDSKFSTVNRGREIWAQDTGVVLSNNETLGQYAARRLQEEQTISTIANYDRSFNPDIIVGDHVWIRYPKYGLDSEFKVTSQTIKIGGGASTSEESYTI